MSTFILHWSHFLNHAISWPSTQPGCYIELFKNLAAAIRDGAELEVKWKEATAVIEMVELAHQSSKAGVTVSVPEI